MPKENEGNVRLNDGLGGTIVLEISKEYPSLNPSFECPNCGLRYDDITPEESLYDQASVECSCDECLKPFHIFRRKIVHHTITAMD